MKPEGKRVAKVALFLGGLCGLLGLLIASVDLLTRSAIAQNKTAKEQAGLAKAFVGETYSFDDSVVVEEEDYPALEKYWTVREEETECGRVYRAAGSNAYGDVALLVALALDGSLHAVVALENTQSFGQVLEDEYLTPLSLAADKDEAKEDVHCGATYGAKLCRELIRQSQDHYREGQQ